MCTTQQAYNTPSGTSRGNHSLLTTKALNFADLGTQWRDPACVVTTPNVRPFSVLLSQCLWSPRPRRPPVPSPPLSGQMDGCLELGKSISISAPGTNGSFVVMELASACFRHSMTEPILIVTLLHISGDSLQSHQTCYMVFKLKLKNIPLAHQGSSAAFTSLLV